MGSQWGSQWRPTPRDSLRQSATIIAARWLVERRRTTSRDAPAVPSKQRVAGSNPAGRADLGKRLIVEPFEATTALLQQDPTLRAVFNLARHWPSNGIEPGLAVRQWVRSAAATLVGVKVSEILRLIGSDGWYLDRQKGSHRQYKHPSKRGLVTVAGKPSDELHPKTRDSILRQAGLNEDGSQADDVPRRGES